MDPITLALLASTAVSAGGAFMGAKNTSDANASNQRIAEMNYAQKEREHADALRIAEENKRNAQLGYTDPNGGRVYFDPQRGWVSELSSVDQAQNTRGIEAGGAADRLLQEFQRFQPMTGERMSGLLYDKATRGINDAFGGQLSQGLRTATRQGNDRLAGAMLGESSRKQGEAQRDAAIDSELKGREYADSYNTNQRSALANLYGAFAGQAGKQVEGPSKYIPTLTGAASGANSGLLQTAMAGGPSMQPVQPDNAFASALSSVGQLGYGAAKEYTTNQNLQTQLGILKDKYAPTTNTKMIGLY